MQTMNKGGDVLARGNARCQFAPMGGGISQEKWDAMWKEEEPAPVATEGSPTPAEEPPAEKETNRI